MLSATEFSKKYSRLIIAAWMVPALFGLSFIGYIEILTIDQLIIVITTPTEPAFILIFLLFSHWHLKKHINPLVQYLEDPESSDSNAALNCMKSFPLHFWALFLAYLVTAPTSVILSAEYYSDYVAQPVDWFRIHLVALIVSIIVGLPIFFKVLDLFGKAVRKLEILSPHITVKTKVFLIGALVPLLIDTMIVQYYWTRTGFFTIETFFVWLFLELLAIGGSLIFVHSFAQSLYPLEDLVKEDVDINKFSSKDLLPSSTDEIGVLTMRFHYLFDELDKHKNNLEELVDVRTQELQRLNEELESFSYSVSHDLRAPLRSIDGFSQAIMEDYGAEFDDTCQDYFNRIRKATQTMAELIDDILQLSRISRLSLEKERVDLSVISNDIVDTFKPEGHYRNIEIHIEPELICQCDKNMIKIVMTNLIENAWKYTNNENIATIKIGKQNSNDDTVFYVKDNGVGFDMQYSSNLFGAFQRLHSSHEFEGTGIGLATVKRIINRHGGEVWAESKPNEGATFYFTV